VRNADSTCDEKGDRAVPPARRAIVCIAFIEPERRRIFKGFQQTLWPLCHVSS
jgi:hypothetical protein